MHYKDGTPAELGDIVQHDSGAVGIVIGGTIGSDYCSTQVVKFEPAVKQFGCSAYVGTLRDTDGKIVGNASVRTSLDPHMQTRECLKIGHVDLAGS